MKSLAILMILAMAFISTGCAKKTASEQLRDDMKKAGKQLEKDMKAF